jgi:hypothetical protein
MTRRARPADACIAELTGLTDLAGWPEGMRLIVCTECPTPTAQRRFTGIDGHRFLRSLPAPGAVSPLTCSYGTGTPPGMRTATAPRCATCRSTAPTRIRSGAMACGLTTR